MKKYKHLGQSERYHIYVLLKAGFTQKSIAEELEVSPSTISRELQRNCGQKGYRHKQANRLATERCSRAAKTNVRRVPESTKQEAIRHLNLDWSPDQIAKSLSAKGMPVSHETIYQWVIRDQKAGGDLFKHLRRRRKKYNRRLGKEAGRGLIQNRIPIEQRPAGANNRTQYGHWEADTVIGRQTKGNVLVTLVERKSRFLLTAKAMSKSAADVNEAILQLLQPYACMVRTITFDNGKEFAYHDNVAGRLGCKTFFANPYHSWERGSNENANGLLRQYFPKGKGLDDVADEDVLEAQNKINTRPKRVLEYNTPQTVFNKALKRYQRLNLRI